MSLCTRAVVTVLLSLALSCGCGYSLAGRGSFLPEDIRVIAIPAFESTARPAVAEKMRNAVVDEFNGRGRYRVVDSENEADAVLRGTITSFLVTPLNFGSEDFADRSQIVVAASATLKRARSGELLYENVAFSFRGEFEVQSEGDEFFDAEPEIVDELAEKFAISLVTSILENF